MATEVAGNGHAEAPAVVPAIAPASSWVVAFDFATKTCAAIDPHAAAAAMNDGKFVWLDFDTEDPAPVRALVLSLGLVREQALDHLFTGEPGTQLSRYEQYIHLVLATGRVDSAGSLVLKRIDVVLGEKFLLTLHRGTEPMIEAVKRDHHADFVRFAKTPSFLLYELWDHLIDHYLSLHKQLEMRVEQLQVELLRTVDDQVFARISEIGAALLHFRSVLAPARPVLTELSTRRMIFISEATQTFLGNMVGTIERLLQDVLVDRESLTQSLNLHMSMISHRTNRAMNKLTIISTIFLPLSFICGIYGMNFDMLPELHWKYGYVFFWAVCATIVGVALYMIRKNDLL